MIFTARICLVFQRLHSVLLIKVISLELEKSPGTQRWYGICYEIQPTWVKQSMAKGDLLNVKKSPRTLEIIPYTRNASKVVLVRLLKRAEFAFLCRKSSTLKYLKEQRDD